MAQNYLIFAQGRKIEIARHAAPETVLVAGKAKEIVADDKLKKQLLPRVTQLEKGKLENFKIQTSNPLYALEKLKACYDKNIVAAGGLVQNDKGELLVIFRNGKWDLPKGKLEKGENTATGALREVQEETGLQQVKLLREFQSTYHTYLEKNKRILKETAWYLMQCNDTHTTPQTEEGITRIEWISKAQSRSVMQNSYDNIVLLIKAFFKG